jgi:hypothetical protein|tara:strand:- start:491 stop:655 length:165 start_codon:yes stop_codon:yes gene_type:complete
MGTVVSYRNGGVPTGVTLYGDTINEFACNLSAGTFFGSTEKFSVEGSKNVLASK